MHCIKCPPWLYKKCDDYYDCVYPIYAAGVEEGKNINQMNLCSSNHENAAAGLKSIVPPCPGENCLHFPDDCSRCCHGVKDNFAEPRDGGISETSK